MCKEKEETAKKAYQPAHASAPTFIVGAEDAGHKTREDVWSSDKVCR
jgi:hypothetical protein